MVGLEQRHFTRPHERRFGRLGVIVPEHVQHAMLLGAGESVAFELTIPNDAAVVGRSVSEIAAQPDFPPSCVFAALFDRAGMMQSPRGATVVGAAQQVLLVARRVEMPRVVELFMRPR